MKRGIKRSIKLVFIVLIFVMIVGIFFQRQWFYDFLRGKQYTPTSEVARIRDELSLAHRGRFLFDASKPTLNSSDDFNSYCRTNEEEIAILGCYTAGNIYVYDIREEELRGIRELTMAHELLHVMYARMSENEKNALRDDLEGVYLSNVEILERELDTYDEAERLEELYVRVGTEVKELPKNLEEHYARIFNDQDRIVDYYESYIGVFRTIEAELNSLSLEMGKLADEINEKTSTYEKEINQFNADVISFNSCAEVSGCFESQNEFGVRRGLLLNKQKSLDDIYYEINALIDRYNSYVEEYNNNVIRSERLNRMINSSKKTDELK